MIGNQGQTRQQQRRPSMADRIGGGGSNGQWPAEQKRRKKRQGRDICACSSFRRRSPRPRPWPWSCRFLLYILAVSFAESTSHSAIFFSYNKSTKSTFSQAKRQKRVTDGDLNSSNSKHATPVWAVLWLGASSSIWYVASPFIFLGRTWQRWYLNLSEQISISFLLSFLPYVYYPNHALFFVFPLAFLLLLVITAHVLLHNTSLASYSPVINYMYNHKILKNNEGFLYISFSHSDYSII